MGGDIRQAVDSVTSIITGILSGNIAGGLAGATAPHIAELIKQHTKKDDNRYNEKANKIAHALLGGVVAQLQGNSALAGAVGAAGGEAAAALIAQALYPNKSISELTQEERERVNGLAAMASGIAGVVTDGSIGVVNLVFHLTINCIN